MHVIAADSKASSHNMYNILHTQTWESSTNGTIITIRPFTLIIQSKYSEPVGGLIKTPLVGLYDNTTSMQQFIGVVLTILLMIAINLR